MLGPVSFRGFRSDTSYLISEDVSRLDKDSRIAGHFTFPVIIGTFSVDFWHSLYKNTLQIGIIARWQISIIAN